MTLTRNDMLANKQFYISVSLLLVATVGLFLGVVLPTIFSIKEIRQEINGEHAHIQNRYHRRGELKETLLHLKEIKVGVGLLTTVAVREGSELEFVQALEEIATRYGVEQEIKLGLVNQTELSDWELEVPITIITEGDYVNVLNYINDLESLPYYIVIDSFNFDSTRSKNVVDLTSEPVKAAMFGTIYWITDNIPTIIDPASI